MVDHRGVSAMARDMDGDGMVEFFSSGGCDGTRIFRYQRATDTFATTK